MHVRLCICMRVPNVDSDLKWVSVKLAIGVVISFGIDDKDLRAYA